MRCRRYQSNLLYPLNGLSFVPLRTDHKVVHEPRGKYIYLALNGYYSESVLLLFHHKINATAEMHEHEPTVKVNILYK